MYSTLRSRLKKIWFWRILRRRLLLAIFITSCFAVSTSVAHADTFYPSGDTKYCEFAQAAAISYSNLPTNSVAAGMTYNGPAVKGVSLNWIKSTDFEDIGDVTYPDARRKNGIASFVYVPPNTTVDLDVYYFNFSGHSVDVEEGIFYTSMPDPTAGDLTRLGAPGIYQTNTFKYNGINVTRSGKAHKIQNWKVVPPNSLANLPKGERFVSFQTIQPVRILERNITPEFRDGALYLKYLTKVKNISQYILPNIRLEDTFLDGSTQIYTTTLNPNVTKTFEYEKCLCYEYPYELQLPRLKVTDPSEHIETAAVGTSALFSYEPETRVFFTKRHDLGAPSNWLGVQGDFTTVGSGDFIRVGLMAYELYSDYTHISLKPDIRTLPIISDIDEADDVQITTEEDQVISITPEISNNGAYIKDLKIQIDFDSELVEFKSENADFIDGNTIVMTIPKINNSETTRPEFKFVPLANLPTGSHEAIFHIKVDGGKYYFFEKDLISEISISESSSTNTQEVNYSIPVSNIEYLKNAIPSNATKTLATTGQFNFYFIISFFIMAGIWLIVNFEQKLKKSRNRVGFMLYYPRMLLT